MKAYFFIVALVISLLSCSTKERGTEISYIKVLTQGLADSITAYNKGFNLHNFLYYEPRKDSVVARFATDYVSDTFVYNTSIGQFDNPQYLDTLLTLVKMLRRYDNGRLPVKLGENDMYCGASFFVEFKDSKGTHNYTFITDRDTIEQFDKFFHRLVSLPWKRKLVANTIINGEAEIVNAFKKAGIYDSIPTPYIPMPCQAGIDFSKLAGTWRTIEDMYSDNQMNYYKLIVLENGEYNYEKVSDGVAKKITSGTISINAKDSTLTFKSGNKEGKYQIVTLSDNCLEYQERERKVVIRLDRLLSRTPA